MSGDLAARPASSPDGAHVRVIGKELSNWGRWGSSDEVGTLNLITDKHRLYAGGLIRRGSTFELSMPLDSAGPQPGGRRFNPIHRMTRVPSDGDWADGMVVADDVIIMPLQCGTQWDGLAHVGYDGHMYNAQPASTVTASSGATKNSFDRVVNKTVGRGVLLDMARLKGLDILTESNAIGADDLEAAVMAQGVSVGQGDILLIRTGWYSHFRRGDIATYMGESCPGLDLSSCAWLHDRQVAAVATDTYAVEIRPTCAAPAPFPVHMVLIRDMGMTLGEMFDLEELALDCAADGVYEFFFSGIGLKITGSVGSPVTPIAIK